MFLLLDIKQTMTLKNIARTYLFEYSHCFDIQIPDDISTETSENDEELQTSPSQHLQKMSNWHVQGFNN